MSESVDTQAQEAPLLPPTPSAAMLRTLGLVAAISGFLVVLVYQFTLPIIAENQRIAIEILPALLGLKVSGDQFLKSIVTFAFVR